MQFWDKSIIFSIIKITGIYYLSPSNTTYNWNFGFLALIFLLLQIITGILLAMFYNPSVVFAYETIMYINNEVYYGWWFRLLHANGASFFFLVVYLHMFRGIYYGSFNYPRQLLWISGIILWILMIAAALFGYVLPWGQMSFWAVMVITSLLAALPVIGADFIVLLWGGFSIDDASLHRFYSLHFAIPFIILFISLIHVALLHEFGSNNPLGIISKHDVIPFTPFFLLKNGVSLIVVLLLIFLIIFCVPDFLLHSDNFIKANFMVTPTHIVPEWYFLPLYAVLRSVTHKLLGLLLFALFIVAILLMPYFNRTYLIRSNLLKPLNGAIFWLFLVNCLFLGWIGGLTVDFPYNLLGQIFTFMHFFIIIILFPLTGLIERYIYINISTKKTLW